MSSIDNSKALLQSLTRRCLLTAATVAWACGIAAAQNPQVQTQSPRIPTVTFTLVNWEANPRTYSIAVSSTGNTTYQSSPDSVAKTGAPYTEEFLMTRPTRDKIFDLAAALHRFKGLAPGSTNSGSNRSIKTLSYQYAGVKDSITYRKSGNKFVQQLTSIFENISATMELGRRLSYLERHEPQRVGPELQQLATQAKNGSLREVQALGPTLRGISSNKRLQPRIRRQAAALLSQYPAVSS